MRAFWMGAMLVSFAAAKASAEPAHHVLLEWHAASGCIDQETLARTVEETLGRLVFRSTAKASASIEGTMGPGAGGFRALIQLRSPNGDVLAERALETDAASCDRLDESAAIVVALMVDSVAEPASPPLPPAPLKIPPTPPRPRAVEPRARRSIEGEVGAALAFGLLPNASIGGYLRGAIMGDVWSAGLTASAWSPSRTTRSGVSVEIMAFSGTLDGCLSPAHRPNLRFDVCGLIGAGVTQASPSGLTMPIDQQLPFGFAGLGTALSIRLGGIVWAYARATVWGMFALPEYFFHDPSGAPTTLFRGWPIVPALTLGIALRGS